MLTWYVLGDALHHHRHFLVAASSVTTHAMSRLLVDFLVAGGTLHGITPRETMAEILEDSRLLVVRVTMATAVRGSAGTGEEATVGNEAYQPAAA